MNTNFPKAQRESKLLLELWFAQMQYSKTKVMPVPNKTKTPTSGSIFFQFERPEHTIVAIVLKIIVLGFLGILVLESSPPILSI